MLPSHPLHIMTISQCTLGKHICVVVVDVALVVVVVVIVVLVLKVSHPVNPEMQKAASVASALVLFFPPTVLIFCLYTRKTC